MKQQRIYQKLKRELKVFTCALVVLTARNTRSSECLGWVAATNSDTRRAVPVPRPQII